jgi:osmotically inducible protein OsmC
MKFVRRASANWKGGKEGKGSLTTQSNVLNQSLYAVNSRFGEEKGTNPEELVGAAHAGCFTMKLSIMLEEAGFTATNLDTTAKVTFEDGKISNILLDLKAEVPGIEQQKFQELAEEAKVTCPISKSLNTTIELNAKLA